MGSQPRLALLVFLLITIGTNAAQALTVQEDPPVLLVPAGHVLKGGYGDGGWSLSAVPIAGPAIPPYLRELGSAFPRIEAAAHDCFNDLDGHTAYLTPNVIFPVPLSYASLDQCVMTTCCIERTTNGFILHTTGAGSLRIGDFTVECSSSNMGSSHPVVAGGGAASAWRTAFLGSDMECRVSSDSNVPPSMLSISYATVRNVQGETYAAVF